MGDCRAMAKNREIEKWAYDVIMSLPVQFREQALIGYNKTYSEAYHKEDVVHKKENAATFAANSRLRRFRDRIKEKGYKIKGA